MAQRQCTHSKMATSTRLSVLCTCLLIEILLCCKFGHGNSATGGGYANPSMYGSYQNNNQQHWPSQQQQQQYHPQNQYFDNDQYQQQQQQQQQPDRSESTIDELTPPPLPPGWSEHIDPSSGQPYYYNANDGSTTWDRPPPLPTANETIIENEGMEQQQQQQQFDSPQSYSLSLSNNTDSKEDLLNEGAGQVETLSHTNPESLSVVSDPSPDDDALTSIGRDENKVNEEEQWREAQGWNAPQSDKIDGGTNHNSNIGMESDTSMKQHSQGWNLPPPQNQANNAWGIGRTPQNGMHEHAAIHKDEEMSQTRHAAVPTPNQSQQQKQLLDEPTLTQESSILSNAGLESKTNIAPPHFHRPPERDDGKQFQTSQHRVSDSATPIEQASPRVNVDGMNQRQVPQYQAIQQDVPRYVQQPPPTAYSRPPPGQGNPYQYTQQRPGVPGLPPYPQHQGSNPYTGSQQPQHQDGANYRQHTGRPMMNQYPPPNQANPQQGYSPQAAGQGGQLITQEQQNLVKESLGRTWQSILGLKDKTKEVVETATSTVAQSAREATQTIAEKGTGWWGQAKSVIGSVFESEPIQEYSLSGIYGNAPPAPAKQDPPRNYPMNQNYPPQSRYPPQQQYPPQGPNQQQLPSQGRYPPGYGPPQPRVDTPYPYQQQESRQAMPPIQRQVDGNVPQQRYSPQNRPYDPSQNEYNQHMRPGQQAPPPQQQHPRNPDDASSAWSHPGLTSDY